MADPSNIYGPRDRSRGSAAAPTRMTRRDLATGPLGAADDFYNTPGARSPARPMSKGQSLHDMNSYKGWSPAQPNPHNLRGRM